MEFLSRYWAQTRTHMSGMSTSGRLAVALCLVLVTAGFWSLYQWGGAPQRVALLSQPLSPDEQANMIEELKALRIDYAIADGEIQVPESDRRWVLARLSQAHLLPANTAISFAKLMESTNPFLPREEARWQKVRALEAELSDVLSRFDGLNEARVFIQTPERRRIGGTVGKPTASVKVTQRSSGPIPQAMVRSIAEFVSGAVEGLAPHDVSISDGATGRSFRVPDPNDPLSVDVLAIRSQCETVYTQKINEHLAYIPGVLVGVNAEVDLDQKSVDSVEYGKIQPSSESSISNRSNQSSGAAGPGARPNVGAAVTGGGRDQSTESEDSKTEFNGLRDTKRTTTTMIPGSVKRLTASINVPRSYFVRIFKEQSDKADEPKDADLDPIITAETQRIRRQVKPLIAAATDEQVEVGWYYDGVTLAMTESGGLTGAAAMAGTSGTGGSITVMMGEHWPKIALGVMALVALAFVARIAKKANAAVVEVGKAVERASRVEEPETRHGLDPLRNELDLAGAAEGGELPLIGQELDEADLRVRHITEQIGQFVEEDLGTAVMLLEQWIAAARS